MLPYVHLHRRPRLASRRHRTMTVCFEHHWTTVRKKREEGAWVRRRRPLLYRIFTHCECHDRPELPPSSQRKRWPPLPSLCAFVNTVLSWHHAVKAETLANSFQFKTSMRHVFLAQCLKTASAHSSGLLVARRETFSSFVCASRAQHGNGLSAGRCLR